VSSQKFLIKETPFIGYSASYRLLGIARFGGFESMASLSLSTNAAVLSTVRLTMAVTSSPDVGFIST
jgi:hypothetical protein